MRAKKKNVLLKRKMRRKKKSQGYQKYHDVEKPNAIKRRKRSQKWSNHFIKEKKESDLKVNFSHRITPTSNGVSLRKLPTVSFKSILDCCDFYRKKCSGIIDTNTKSARYLFDFSGEINKLCLLLENHIDHKFSRYAKQCDYYKNVCSEWITYFGVDFLASDFLVNENNFTTPKILFEEVRKQKKEIEKLKREKFQAEKNYRECEKRCQMIITRKEEINQRVLKRKVAELNNQVRKMLAKERKTFQKLIDEKEGEKIKLKKKFAQKIGEYEDEIVDMKTTIRQNDEIFQKKIETLKLTMTNQEVKKKNAEGAIPAKRGSIHYRYSQFESENMIALKKENQRLHEVVKQLEKARYMNQFYNIKKKIKDYELVKREKDLTNILSNAKSKKEKIIFNTKVLNDNVSS